MLNVNDLERRWRKYKIKSYLPQIVIFISLLIIFILISTIKNNELLDNNVIEEAKEIDEVEIVTKQNTININKVEKTFNESTHENKKLVLSPSLDFISNIKHSSISRYDNDEVHSNKIYKKKKIQKQKVKKQKAVEKKEIEKKSIKISRQNTQEDINHVIKRFKKNNNPALSLFVARKYYELEDYQKSYNYALITNEINDNIDASWIIFAKSLVKLNEKDEAIKTLKKYIEHAHSSQAKILLDEIKSGKFR
jgi:tetratricopeptide (TPR) repeat protein